MTPEPSPTVNPELIQETSAILAESAFIVLGTGLTIGVIAFVILRAAKHPFPTSIIVALTILAAVSLLGYIFGGESRSELAAIAGTAVGALAGGVTALLTKESKDGPEEE